MRLILASQGAGPEHIVKMTIYAVSKPADPAKISAKRAELFAGQTPPPSTWVVVSGLARPVYLIEVEAIAAVPSGAR